MRLVFGEDTAVAEWVRRRIDTVGARGFGPCSAIGISNSSNRPIAGVVYNEWVPEYHTMQVSIAADDPRWAQRGIIRALLSYPFEQVGVRKLWSVMRSDNERAIRFNLGIGFSKEATLAHQFGKQHGVVTRMFDKDFNRKYGVHHGEVVALTAARA